MVWSTANCMKAIQVALTNISVYCAASKRALQIRHITCNDPPGIMFVELEKYLLAMQYIMILPACLHCVPIKHLMKKKKSTIQAGHQTNIQPTNRHKNSVWVSVGCSILALRVQQGSQKTAVILGGWRQARFVAWRKSPSKRKFLKTTVNCWQ